MTSFSPRTGLVLVVMLSVLAGTLAVTRQMTSVSNEQRMIRDWKRVDYLDGRVARFHTVFWEPKDTTSLRQRIFLSDVFRDREILEIGTGSGLISLCCLQVGASRVVATDINPNAIENARFNARQRGYLDRFELRLVRESSPGAFAVIPAGEKFDYVISNPPWEDGVPNQVDDYAYYDPGFRLLDSLLAELEDRLKPGGCALLAYGCVSAIRAVYETAPRYGLRVETLDDRNLDELEEVFLPGMLLRVVPDDSSASGQSSSRGRK